MSGLAVGPLAQASSRVLAHHSFLLADERQHSFELTDVLDAERNLYMGDRGRERSSTVPVLRRKRTSEASVNLAPISPASYALSLFHAQPNPHTASENCISR